MLLEIIIFLVVMSLRGGDVESSPPQCDSSIEFIWKEGIVGETTMFQWLGIIKVHLHEESLLRVALTGIVLVKEGYAIANADDVARIPKRIFKEDSIAMFVPCDGVTWYCRLQNYLTHPEYKRETVSSIALIELDSGDISIFPVRPICWPSYAYHPSNQLYAAGYTDNNVLLEKFILKLQHIDQTTCEELYSKLKLSKVKAFSIHYQCAYTKDSGQNCVWDNGMAIISDASGHWTLVGLSLLGAGCAAPGRYLDLLPYFQWIDSATNLLEVNDYVDYRKSSVNEVVKPKQQHTEELEDMPAPDLLKTINDNLGPVIGRHDLANYYPPEKKLNNENFLTIYRSNQRVINIYNQNQKIKSGYDDRMTTEDKQKEDCSLLHSNRHIYDEYFQVTVPGQVQLKKNRSMRFKLLIYDLDYLNSTCVRVEASSPVPETAHLYYATEIDQLEDDGFSSNPNEILIPIIIKPLIAATLGKPATKKQHIISIYLRLRFQEHGWFNITIYGPGTHIKSTTEKVITSSTTISSTTTLQKTKSTTQNPYHVTDALGNESLRNETGAINGSLRDNDIFEDDSASDDTDDDISTTSSTLVLDWGRQTNDDDRDDRRYWNTWKRSKNKANKNWPENMTVKGKVRKYLRKS